MSQTWRYHNAYCTSRPMILPTVGHQASGACAAVAAAHPQAIIDKALRLHRAGKFEKSLIAAAFRIAIFLHTDLRRFLDFLEHLLGCRPTSHGSLWLKRACRTGSCN